MVLTETLSSFGISLYHNNETFKNLKNRNLGLTGFIITGLLHNVRLISSLMFLCYTNWVLHS